MRGIWWPKPLEKSFPSLPGNVRNADSMADAGVLPGNLHAEAPEHGGGIREEEATAEENPPLSADGGNEDDEDKHPGSDAFLTSDEEADQQHDEKCLEGIAKAESEIKPSDPLGMKLVDAIFVVGFKFNSPKPTRTTQEAMRFYPTTRPNVPTHYAFLWFSW